MGDEVRVVHVRVGALVEVVLLWAAHGAQCSTLVKNKFKQWFTLLDLCVSSLRRGHANLLRIVPILTDDLRREPDAACSLCSSTLRFSGRFFNGVCSSARVHLMTCPGLEPGISGSGDRRLIH